MTTSHIINIPDIPFRIELFHLSDDAHDRERFRRRRRAQALDREVSLPTVEDVIITKLRWSLQGRRPKDLDDARDVLAVQGDHVDWEYLHAGCDRHGTRGLLDELRRSLPPLDT